MCILHNQNHACWWPDSFGRHDIISYGIDIFPPECPSLNFLHTMCPQVRFAYKGPFTNMD